MLIFICLFTPADPPKDIFNFGFNYMVLSIHDIKILFSDGVLKDCELCILLFKDHILRIFYCSVLLCEES